MSYLKEQVASQLPQLSSFDTQIINVLEQNANCKLSIHKIIELANEQLSYEQVDSLVSKLVARNLISEVYIDDKRYFEYSISSSNSTQKQSDEIIAELKEKGYRITDSRKRLIELFTSMPNRHFSFDELVNLSGDKVNIATMYNNLAILSEEKVINDMYIKDTRVFELNNMSHAHFICEKCDNVFNVDTKASGTLDSEVREQYGFVVNTRRIEFTGICSDCQTDQAPIVNVINEEQFPLIDEHEITEYIEYLSKRTNAQDKSMTLVFLDSEEVHNLNNEFRGIDRPTDVLTFVEDDEEYLGDVIICYPYIQKQADEYGHNFRRELLFLITHGFLHLLGYDHLNDEDEKEMFALQNELLNKYGVSRDE